MKPWRLCCLCFALAAPAWADSGDFDRLDPDTQAVLSKLRDDWQQLPPEKRAALIQRAQDWQRLPPEQREALKARHERFRQLPPEEQEALRERFREWRKLPPEERRARREEWRARLGEGRPHGGPPGQRREAREKDGKPQKDKHDKAWRDDGQDGPGKARGPGHERREHRRD